jgi:general secretion pathway protein K
LEASLEDLQGRFNLNWLVASDGTNAGKADPNMVQVFNLLLQFVGVEPKWTDLIVDWIDADTSPMPEGGEDSLYLGLNPPFLAANQYITSTSELLALPGFGQQNFAKLAPFIAALPATTALNVCSASPEVLDAFAGEKTWSTDDAGFQKARATATTCYPDTASYSATFADKAFYTTVSAKLKQTSSFFRLTSLVTIGTTEFNLYSLLYMDGSGPLIHPIQRSFAAD